MRCCYLAHLPNAYCVKLIRVDITRAARVSKVNRQKPLSNILL